MKLIVKNIYIQTFKFTSSREASTFMSSQASGKNLSIDDTFGDNYYCYVGYHSLTKVKQFILSFGSEENEDSLCFLIWDDLFVLNTGKNIYLIDESLSVKTSLEITTPLVGLFLVSKDKLLVLEEAYMRIVNNNGDIVNSELFDVIQDFSIKDNLLSIQTSEENRVIKLI
jgi:hypothetical protein